MQKNMRIYSNSASLMWGMSNGWNREEPWILSPLQETDRKGQLVGTFQRNWDSSFDNQSWTAVSALHYDDTFYSACNNQTVCREREQSDRDLYDQDDDGWKNYFKWVVRHAKPHSFPQNQSQKKLDALYERCCCDDWDGEGAKCVTKHTLDAAKIIWRKLLDKNIEVPYLAAAPDGSIGFNWYTQRETIYLNVCEEEVIFARLGAEESCATTGTCQVSEFHKNIALWFEAEDVQG